MTISDTVNNQTVTSSPRKRVSAWADIASCWADIFKITISSRSTSRASSGAPEASNDTSKCVGASWPICGSSSTSAGLLQHLRQGGGINDIKSMLASMTISPTISPFVIDDNNSCSPYEHAPLFVCISPFVFISFLSASLPLSSSLPLWHQWQRVSTYLSLESLITVDCSPCQYACPFSVLLQTSP